MDLLALTKIIMLCSVVNSIVLVLLFCIIIYAEFR
jgi:hypothetical protein